MKLISLSAGEFKGDGGALFSVIPKVLWSKVMPSDEYNFVKLSLRCLLVDQGSRKILIETGVGEHYNAKFMRNHGLKEGSHLLNSLVRHGYQPEEITDVLFTHLHWDHFNGAVKSVDGQLNLTFPNATHWCSKKQWEHAQISNAREDIAYSSELLDFLNNSGKLGFVETAGKLLPNISVSFFDGHTPGQMIPCINYQGKTIVYMADLIPTAANIPLVWLASYDLFPVTALEEKERFLTEAAENAYILFFEHDYYTECATVIRDEKGFRAKDKFKLSELE